MADFSEKFYDSIIHLDKYISFWASIIALLTTFSAIYTIRTWRKEHVDKMRINLLLESINYGERTCEYIMELLANYRLSQHPYQYNAYTLEQHLKDFKEIIFNHRSLIARKHKNFRLRLTQKRQYYDLLFEPSFNYKKFNPFQEYENCFHHMIICCTEAIQQINEICDDLKNKKIQPSEETYKRVAKILSDFSRDHSTITRNGNLKGLYWHINGVIFDARMEASKHIMPNNNVKKQLSYLAKIVSNVYHRWIVLLQKMHKDLERL